MTILAKKVGGSVAVVIPKALARDMGLVDGTPLEILGDSEKIVMRRSRRRPRRRLSDLVKQMNVAAYRRHNREFANDLPSGKEIW